MMRIVKRVEVMAHGARGFAIVVEISSLPMSQFVEGTHQHNLKLGLGPDNIERAAETMVQYATDYARVLGLCTASDRSGITTTRRGNTINITIPEEGQGKIGEIVEGFSKEFERPE